MLRLRGEQMETLWDAVLPAEMLALPPDLARLDALCDDGELLGPFWAGCCSSEGDLRYSY